MTDYETTPEYGAWVEARRTAVEAQRADLEAAIRGGWSNPWRKRARTCWTSMGKTICR